MTDEIEYVDITQPDGSILRLPGHRWRTGGPRQVVSFDNWVPLRQDRARPGKWLPPIRRTYIFGGQGDAAPAPSTDPNHEVAFVPFGSSVLIPADRSSGIQRVDASGQIGSGMAPLLMRVSAAGQASSAPIHPALDPARKPPAPVNDPKKLARIMQRAAKEPS